MQYSLGVEVSLDLITKCLSLRANYYLNYCSNALDSFQINLDTYIHRVLHSRPCYGISAWHHIHGITSTAKHTYVNFIRGKLSRESCTVPERHLLNLNPFMSCFCLFIFCSSRMNETHLTDTSTCTLHAIHQNKGVRIRSSNNNTENNGLFIR